MIWRNRIFTKVVYMFIVVFAFRSMAALPWTFWSAPTNSIGIQAKVAIDQNLELLEAETNASIPYDIDQFQPLDGKPTTFSLNDFKFFTVVDDSYQNQSWPTEMDEVSSMEAIAMTAAPSTICRVVCRFPENSFGLQHFPHFLQQAYPCWSLLQAFHRTAVHFYIQFPATQVVRKSSSYINSFLDAIHQNSALHIGVLNGNESLPVLTQTDQCYNRNVTMSIVAERDFATDTGWDRPVRYFRNHSNDLTELQRAVLGSDFNEGPSSTFPAFLHILLLCRKGSSRDWVNANHTKRFLLEQRPLQIFGQRTTVLNVTLIESFTGWTLQQQAQAIHSADVIVSTHGAQLSNLAYLRPCAVVVELFPRYYYLQFFQSLVTNANGISYEGYPDHGNRTQETLRTRGDREFRTQVRSVNLRVSPRSVVDAIPKLIQASLQCRQEFELRNTMPNVRS